MSTYESDVREYQNFKAGTMKPATTRGIVVSNVDPLFAGRVKVWIPAIHGATPYDENGELQLDEDIAVYNNKFGGRVAGSSSFKESGTQGGLPWATVLSHNLGPIQNLESGISQSAGIFSLPSPGTEVIIMFENNDPKLPIVVGSIIHANEFRHSMSNPLEYLPGITLTTPIQTEVTANKSEVTNGTVNSAGESYTTLAAEVYNLRTKTGSTLFISESALSRAIVLEGVIGYGEKSTLTPYEISTLDQIYPAFPTTASAAFAKRTVLSSSGASPLMSPTNFIGSDAISSTGIITVTPSIAANVPTTAPSDANNGLITQAIYDCSISSSIQKTLPMPGSCELTPGPNAKWHAPPSNIRKHIHQGIDIPSPGGKLPLLAPIDCFPLAYKQKGIGWMLLVLGIDGFGHAFEHLNYIEPKIKKIIDSRIATKINIGERLGKCGITIAMAGNTGSHLHWEVWNASNVRTPEGIVISRSSAWATQSTIDPMNSWLRYPKTSFKKFDNTDPINRITGTPEQIASIYVNSATQYSSDNAPEFSKPAGLEISLVPGKETVVLRHPSGSSIGFDPDGNILIYSSGDINFRANRSITYDVLGVILENAYAKYSRIRTVMKYWTRALIPGSAKDIADAQMPEFFTRVDNCRVYDMTNALASSINNSFIIDSDGNEVSPASLASSVSSTSTTETKPYKINADSVAYDLEKHDWDTTITKFFANYKGIIDFNSIYSMMLVESNGDSTWGQSSSSKVGLYGITQDMLSIVGKDTTTKLSDYVGTSTRAVESNVDVAFQYLMKVESLLTNALRQGIRGSTITIPDNMSNADFKFLVILAYRLGIAQTIQTINQLVIGDTASPKITYLQVENVCIIQQVESTTLSYVPTVDKLSKIVKPK